VDDKIIIHCICCGDLAFAHKVENILILYILKELKNFPFLSVWSNIKSKEYVGPLYGSSLLCDSTEEKTTYAADNVKIRDF
jgi:hypothetical protein